ncbi:MAG: glycosyltransferase [Cytophagaceae bacterium]
MRVVLVNVNSFGGNFSYSLALAKAYSEKKEVESCTLIVPKNTYIQNISEKVFWKPILCNDQPTIQNKWLRRFHFVYRALIGPMKLWWYLLMLPRSVVVFNDYEQATTLFWVPFFLILKRKHSLGVILHDPDRDAYMRWKPLSVLTMKCFMRIPHVAFYHEYLPSKSYYRISIPFVNVPHGVYLHGLYDKKLFDDILFWKGNASLWVIPGNIREEKNYLAIIRALKKHPNSKLLIAGKLSSSRVNIDLYKTEAVKEMVSERIMWIEKFLSEEEFQSVIKVSDIVLLYYKDSFVSQSGILNIIAPHKKRLLTSKINSALSNMVAKYSLGVRAELNDEKLSSALAQLENEDNNNKTNNWDTYMNENSWKAHVEIALGFFNKKI